MNEMFISILSSIGGTSLILGGLFGWLGQRYLAKILEKERSENRANLAEIQRDFTKEIETHKNQLSKEIELHKNQLAYDTTFFNNLFEASNCLFAITQKVLPRKSHPDMCWVEACEDIAHSFKRIEKELDEYLTKYFTPLPPEIVESINSAISCCSEGKFEVMDGAVSKKGIDFGEELFKTLDKTSIKLKSIVDEKRTINSSLKFKK